MKDGFLHIVLKNQPVLKRPYFLRRPTSRWASLVAYMQRAQRSLWGITFQHLKEKGSYPEQVNIMTKWRKELQIQSQAFFRPLPWRSRSRKKVFPQKTKACLGIRYNLRTTWQSLEWCFGMLFKGVEKTRKNFGVLTESNAMNFFTGCTALEHGSLQNPLKFFSICSTL